MKICRFKTTADDPRVGLMSNDAILDLTPAGITRLEPVLEADGALLVGFKPESYAAALR